MNPIALLLLGGAAVGGYFLLKPASSAKKKNTTDPTEPKALSSSVTDQDAFVMGLNLLEKVGISPTIPPPESTSEIGFSSWEGPFFGRANPPKFYMKGTMPKPAYYWWAHVAAIKQMAARGFGTVENPGSYKKLLGL